MYSKDSSQKSRRFDNRCADSQSFLFYSTFLDRRLRKLCLLFYNDDRHSMPSVASPLFDSRRRTSIFCEFNSAKSYFSNTFLGEKELCSTGVLPTTDTTNIVDTPGTNAILQSHQQITGKLRNETKIRKPFLRLFQNNSSLNRISLSSSLIVSITRSPKAKCVSPSSTPIDHLSPSV